MLNRTAFRPYFINFTSHYHSISTLKQPFLLSKTMLLITQKHHFHVVNLSLLHQKWPSYVF